MKHILFVLVSIGVLSSVFVSGCLDNFELFDTKTVYEDQPTSVRYSIRYGYDITCDGTGSYEIHYLCDLPEVLLGSVSSLTALGVQEYTIEDQSGNQVYSWNLSGDSDAVYTLGVTADVTSRTLLVADLSGTQALTRQQIASQYPTVKQQYCHEQHVDDVVYIDPYHSGISQQAHVIRNQEQTDNAFLLAKALFVWLKENTAYQTHTTSAEVQPAAETLSLLTGDCDDLSFLYISLCRALDIPARFVRGYLITTSETMPSIGPHAWAEVFVGGNLGTQGWIPVECACTASCTANVHQNFGVEDVAHLRLYADDGTNESLESSMTSISWSYETSIDIAAESFVSVTDYIILKEEQLTISNDGLRAFRE